MRESKAVPAGSAKLTYKDKSFDLPVLAGSVGPDVVDIRQLYAQADVFTYDPSFTSTASCEVKLPSSTATKHCALSRLSDR